MSNFPFSNGTFHSETVDLELKPRVALFVLLRHAIDRGPSKAEAHAQNHVHAWFDGEVVLLEEMRTK